VPVIRDVDRLSVLGIAQELVNVAQKVRDVQFGIDDLRGGSFTVTNYGAIGGIWGTPIINHPEVAILGIGRTQERLVLEDEELIGKQMLPLSISFDHRATDGAQAARFLNDVVAHLSNPGLLLIK
jgi:pyruvate dehydrogenase E2 component (dihydrolipoamide acetyltransferase)